MKVKEMLMTGKLSGKEVVMFHVDRSLERSSFNTRICIDHCPPLTCNNEHIFVMSVCDVEKEDSDKEFFRYLTLPERFALQGLDYDAIKDHLDDKLAMKAVGNAYPSSLIMATLCPLVNAIALCDECRTWPPPLTDPPDNEKEPWKVTPMTKATSMKKAMQKAMKKAAPMKVMKRSMKR